MIDSLRRAVPVLRYTLFRSHLCTAGTAVWALGFGLGVVATLLDSPPVLSLAGITFVVAGVAMWVLDARVERRHRKQTSAALQPRER